MADNLPDRLNEMPGRLAEGLARRIERRRFLRNTARTMFIATAAVAAGEGLQAMRAGNAFACDCNDSSCAQGRGCPSGGVYGLHPCGPSPCCSSLSSSCQCATSGGGCKSGGNCHGAGTNIYSSHCWSCTVTQACGNPGCECNYTTTCCDCNVASSCGTPYGRCISWYLTKAGPFCP
jgi:hypothetical protein